MKRHGERIFREKKRYGERKNIDILKRDTYMVHGLERWTSLTCGTVCTPTTKFRLHFTAYALWTLSSHTNVNFTRFVCSWRLCMLRAKWLAIKTFTFQFSSTQKMIIFHFSNLIFHYWIRESQPDLWPQFVFMWTSIASLHPHQEHACLLFI